MPYIELDNSPDREPRDVEDMFQGSVTIEKQLAQPLLPIIVKNKLKEKSIASKRVKKFNNRAMELQDKEVEGKKEEEILLEQLEPVLGPNKEVYFDEDWGLFSAILACYNNHWVLKTGPHDWWTVVSRRIASALDEHGDVEEVREFFVTHKGQKEIIIGVVENAIDYSWLFSQFSSQIRKNINTPGYVDLMQSDFSTTTPDQGIISQVILMSSVKKYFSYKMKLGCGIPGVEMDGTEKDWEMLIEKLNNLETLLNPILVHLQLESLFKSTRVIFTNLLDTYKGKPDKQWWSNIVSRTRYGSGGQTCWSGWFPGFLGCSNRPDGPGDFPSGLVSAPLHIENTNYQPTLNDSGLLIAGTLGFTVIDKPEKNETPRVEPNHIWSLLMPINSPLTKFLNPSH